MSDFRVLLVDPNGRPYKAVFTQQATTIPIPNYWVIPGGSTWADVVAILDDAGAAIGSPPYVRQTVVLPNEPIIVTSHKQLPAIVTLCGSGASSELIYQANYVDAFGGSVGLRTTSGTVIRDFKITHDRAAMGSSGRMIAIAVNASGGASFTGTEIYNMRFQDITGTCCYVGGSNNSLISFHDNRTNEFWEQMLELQGEINGVAAFNNYGYSSSSNPAIPSTEPCGLFIGNEQGPDGEIKNIFLCNNEIDFRDLPSGDAINALPCTLSDGGGGRWRYDRIVIAQNIFRGGVCGVRIQNQKNNGAAATCSIIENFIHEQLGQAVQIGNESADNIYLMHNNLHRPMGSSHAFWGRPDDSAVSGTVNFIQDNNATTQD